MITTQGLLHWLIKYVLILANLYRAVPHRNKFYQNIFFASIEYLPLILEIQSFSQF